MRGRRMRRSAVVLAVGALAALACFENPTSPAQCPDFCPAGGLAIVESLLSTAIERDSSYAGYVQAHQAPVLVASSIPGVQSRPIWVSLPIATRFRIDSGADTTTGPIVVDSMKLTVTVFRADTAAVHNLRLAFYQLPVGIDTTTTLADLAAAFAGTRYRFTTGVRAGETVPIRGDGDDGDRADEPQHDPAQEGPPPARRRETQVPHPDVVEPGAAVAALG